MLVTIHIVIVILLSAFTNNFYGHANSCSLENSLDISDGDHLSGGRIVYDGIYYSPEDYFNYNGTTRGCICKFKRCIPKCCQDYSVLNDTCQPYEQSDLLTFANYTSALNVSYKNFHLVHHDRVMCAGGKLHQLMPSVDYPEDTFILQDDGTLSIPLNLELTGALDTKDYCIEMFVVDEMYIMEISAVICIYEHPVERYSYGRRPRTLGFIRLRLLELLGAERSNKTPRCIDVRSIQSAGSAPKTPLHPPGRGEHPQYSGVKVLTQRKACLPNAKKYKLNPSQYDHDLFYVQDDGNMYRPNSEAKILHPQDYCVDMFLDPAGNETDAVSALHEGHKQIIEAWMSIAEDTEQPRETGHEALNDGTMYRPGLKAILHPQDYCVDMFLDPAGNESFAALVCVPSKEDKAMEMNVIAIPTPCPFVLSINITNADRLSDGTLMSDGYSFSPDQYFLHNGTVRGCICEVKKCIRKCCPFGSAIYGKKCKSYTKPFSVKVHDGEKPTIINGSENDFYYIPSKKCSALGLYQLQPSLFPDDVFYVQHDGNMYMPHQKNKNLRPQDYCVEIFINKKGKESFSALVCNPDEEVSGGEERHRLLLGRTDLLEDIPLQLRQTFTDGSTSTLQIDGLEEEIMPQYNDFLDPSN
ncbi:hypothetical protein ILUMI_21140 [Ignelater luminosus]|uniref:Methuselah N-terminal domain-containing protein n=1 Tax=Ignelater luminosus TaxID=2038154 RepID=A0A8K0CD02_IGNLU|nr:hypothetical protein ILUMI_21140 [Ignelater luminosus]